MIPIMMREEMPRLMPMLDASARVRQAEKESAAIIGFTSAIAAYGALFIPKSYGTSISITGGPDVALIGFLLFYVLCAVVTWLVYSRRGGLLHDVEHKSWRAAPSARSVTIAQGEAA
jgi:NNP family nitrate/nitrite transporter-like MFS transporter